MGTVVIFNHPELQHPAVLHAQCLASAWDAGRNEMTVPDKPRSPLQKD
jgi:hypothetical protein